MIEFQLLYTINYNNENPKTNNLSRPPLMLNDLNNKLTKTKIDYIMFYVTTYMISEKTKINLVHLGPSFVESNRNIMKKDLSHDVNVLCQK
jgi:hypothetical protein